MKPFSYFFIKKVIYNIVKLIHRIKSIIWFDSFYLATVNGKTTYTLVICRGRDNR